MGEARQLAMVEPAPEPGSAPGGAAYENYYESDAWADMRTKKINYTKTLQNNRARPLCEGCGERDATIVHHLTYVRFGHEMLFDLACVCRPCHELLHPEHYRYKESV